MVSTAELICVAAVDCSLIALLTWPIMRLSPSADLAICSDAAACSASARDVVTAPARIEPVACEI